MPGRGVTNEGQARQALAFCTDVDIIIWPDPAQLEPRNVMNLRFESIQLRYHLTVIWNHG
jgi:hypothetical protein